LFLRCDLPATYFCMAGKVFLDGLEQTFVVLLKHLANRYMINFVDLKWMTPF